MGYLFQLVHKANRPRQAYSSLNQICYWALYLIVIWLSSQMCSSICCSFISYFLTCTNSATVALSRQTIKGVSPSKLFQRWLTKQFYEWSSIRNSLRCFFGHFLIGLCPSFLEFCNLTEQFAILDRWITLAEKGCTEKCSSNFRWKSD